MIFVNDGSAMILGVDSGKEMLVVLLTAIPTPVLAPITFSGGVNGRSISAKKNQKLPEQNETPHLPR